MHRYALAALALAASAVYASPAASDDETFARPRNLQKRGNIVQDTQDEYDFVVVGGGLAGLVMGNRLSADGKYSVLVLEAGSTGEAYKNQIDTPGMAYYGDLWNVDLNWAFFTTPQAGLGGDSMQWPRGKVLGGSSAINGMYITRPSSYDLDTWHDLLGDMDGADNWTWDSFFAAMKKSETFTPASSAVAKEGDITWDAASRGTSGPIHMTYPAITFPIVGDWSTACANAGFPATKDAYGGENDGAYVATSCISPLNWTRSYSKSGYLDPLPPMSNYDVMTDAQVTKIEFDTSGSTLVANGVQYTSNNGTNFKTVKVAKEVIISAGSVMSPVVLQHSGIGPQNILEGVGVKTLYNLPGVGQHLQDHLSIPTQWSYAGVTAGDMYWNDNDKSETFLSYVDDAVGFPNAKTLGVDGLTNYVLSNMKSPSNDKSVSAGYEAVVKAVVKELQTSTGQIEILLRNDLNNGTIQIQCTLQHPFSQGSVYINSNDPTRYPSIDPNYLSHPADIEIITAGLKLIRKIGTSEPFSGYLKELYPGTEVQTDAQFDDFIRGNGYTEFHPCSTCSMLPENQGGVVDGNLIVYGTSNVRVADASVPPLEFSSHLMSSTYGIAERASEIILDYWNSPASKNSNSIDQTSKSSSSSSSSNSAASHSVSLVTVFVGIIMAAFACL